jgi:sugar-specific transcriptional regulator TrmB/DNA-binding CsgD family transcriptional regulator
MTEPRDDPADARPLAPLGIGEAEEQAYRALLGHPDATARDVASALGLPIRKTQRLLDVLEAKGLATHSPQRPRRYIPAAPDIAIERLIVQRQEDLERARSAIDGLRERARAAQSEASPERFVEIINSREAEQQVLEHSIRAAREEVLSLVRPPVRVSRLDVPREQDQRLQRQARDRGVRFRTVVDGGFLAVPGTADAVRADIDAREEVRVIAELPIKLVLIDRRVGLIPLDLHQPDSPALLVRSSPLLEALRLLYEQIWDRAAPLSFAHESGPDATAHAELPPAADELVRLLAAGLNDKVIARELRISVRTLERRIANLMGDLDARTRFQLGWQAALRLRSD